MVASLLDSAGPLLTILTPLVAVPLTVITFYLRSLREHQVSWHMGLVRRVEAVEASTIDLRKALAEFERDYTTKEEWLRECMLARRTLEQLAEMSVRLEATMQSVVPTLRSRLRADEPTTGRVATNHADTGETGDPDEGSE